MCFATRWWKRATRFWHIFPTCISRRQVFRRSEGRLCEKSKKCWEICSKYYIYAYDIYIYTGKTYTFSLIPFPTTHETVRSCLRTLWNSTSLHRFSFRIHIYVCFCLWRGDEVASRCRQVNTVIWQDDLLQDATRQMSRAAGRWCGRGDHDGDRRSRMEWVWSKIK